MEHSFDVDVAAKYGLNEAIIFNNLIFWCLHNKANQKSYFDGLYWTYNSVKAYKELFPYLTTYAINKALKHLEALNLIKTGNYNKSCYDKTTWYAVTEYGYSICRNQQIEAKETTNQFVENEEPIPYINTDINTDIKHNKGKSSKIDPFIVFSSDDEGMLNLLKDFEEMRKKIKKPLTDKAKELLITKLQREFPTREAQVATLNQSIINCWQGIFPVKDRQNTNGANIDYSYGTFGVDHL